MNRLQSTVCAWSLMAFLCAHCQSANQAAGVANTNSGQNSPGGNADAATSRIETVVIPTADQWRISAEYAYRAPGPVVVLVHQLGSSRAEWAPLLARLRAGPVVLNTLAIDLRGHGQSNVGPSGPTSWSDFGNDPAKWAGVERDVSAAIAFLRSLGGRHTGYLLVGSSIGSTAVLRAAAQTTDITKVVMLSPGLNYRGMDTLAPMTTLLSHGNPAVFLAASAGDQRSAEALARLRELAPQGGNVVTSVLYENSDAHGVTMGNSNNHPELWERLDMWIREQLGATQPRAVGQNTNPQPPPRTP